MVETISGFTIARNIEKLNYPFEAWLASMLDLNLDEIVINYDPTSEDDTEAIVSAASKHFPNVYAYPIIWNLNNRNGGSELGLQTQLTTSLLRGNWFLYVQLDEAFHADSGPELRELVARAAPNVGGFSFPRVYFYKNVHTIRMDWTRLITRLTRRGQFWYASGDGMNCVPLYNNIAVEPTDTWLFHYSRIGTPEEISYRIRSIDEFYHQPETLVDVDELPPYDFTPREWDNFSKFEVPPTTQGEFIRYLGDHPIHFAEYFADRGVGLPDE